MRIRVLGRNPRLQTQPGMLRHFMQANGLFLSSIVLYISKCFIIRCMVGGNIQYMAKGSRTITMTERQWGTGSEWGERLNGEAVNAVDYAAGDSSPETDLLKHFAMAGGITHEEVLLLLAAPEDIDEALRVSGIRHSGTISPSLNRLLGWSDRNRKLKVMSRTAVPERIELDIRQGAQGIGLIRGEEALQHGLLQEVYSAWLKSRGEKASMLRRRLIMLWTAYWVSVFQAANGSKCAVSLLEDPALSHPMEKREAQDAQLESMFRALEQCGGQGMECQLELLAVQPAHADEFMDIHHFIEEVAEQTLMDQRRFVRIRYGALLDERTNPAAAAEIARMADVIVLDMEGTESGGEPELTEDAVKGFAFAGIIERIRRIKPQLTLRMNGAGTDDLKMVYRHGIHEVSCCSADLAAVRILGARLELRRRCSSSQAAPNIQATQASQG